MNDNRALHHICRDGHAVRVGDYYLPQMETAMEGNGTFMFLKRNTSYSLTFTNGDNGERKIFAQFIIGENK